MRIERANDSKDKGWCLGRWNSSLPISVGYANIGVDEPHLHTEISEIYLTARGTAVMRVEHETITLSAGDVILVEPGEAHTFLESSSDYFHFVIHTPGMVGEKARTEKVTLSRERLGL